MVLRQLAATPLGNVVGKKKYFFFVSLIQRLRSELRLWTQVSGLESKEKYFFLPPVAPNGVASTCSNTTGQRGGDKKK